jgi:truncated hemoglobin YjbI
MTGALHRFLASVSIPPFDVTIAKQQQKVMAFLKQWWELF